MRKKTGREIELTEVLTKIEQADDMEISEIIKAVVQRYKTAFPDWEVVFLSLPRNDPEKRKRTLKRVSDFLMNHPSIVGEI